MRTPLALLLALAAPFSASAGDDVTAPEPRAHAPAQLRVDVGVLSTGLVGTGSAWADTLTAQALSGHVLFGGLTLEGALLSLVPLQSGRTGASLTLTARVGYTGELWSLVGGPVVNLGYGSRPAIQVLPSIQAMLSVGPVNLHAGLLDLHGLVPAHLGASWKGVGLAYVLPVGARAWASIPLTSTLALRLEGFFFQLTGSQSAFLTVGLSARPPASTGVSP
jgi:hypothetical protein